MSAGAASHTVCILWQLPCYHTTTSSFFFVHCHIPPSMPLSSSTTPNSLSYEVLIHLEAKPKPGSHKNAKPELKVFEPCQLSTTLNWDDFLSQLASILNVAKTSLRISRMWYHWSKPKSSTDVPLISEEGYSSMTKNLYQLGKKVSEGGIWVIITMDPPDIQDPVCFFYNFWIKVPGVCKLISCDQ